MKYIFILICFFSSTFANGQIHDCSFIEKLNSYTSHIRFNKIIDSIMLKTDYRDLVPRKLELVDSTFNLDYYLKIFDKLSVKDNYKFNFVFSSSSDPRGNFGGNLKLYAYQDTATLNQSVKAQMRRSFNFVDSIIASKIESNKLNPDPLFEKRMKNVYYYWRNNINYQYSLIQYLLTDPNSEAYLHLKPEKSNEGYFQYITFYLMAKFGLGWYGYASLNSHSKIICSMDDLKQALDRIRNNTGFNKEAADKLLDSGPGPFFEMSNNQCFVTLTEIWSECIRRKKYLINLDDMKITQVKEEFLVCYDKPFD